MPIKFETMKPHHSLKYPVDIRQVTLDNVGTFIRGRGIRNNDLKPVGVKCITYGQIYTKYNEIIRNVNTYVDEKVAINSVKIQKGDVLFTGSGETQEEIGKATIYYSEDECVAGGDIHILRPKKDFDPLYLGYVLNSEIYHRQRIRLGQGYSVVHIQDDQLRTISLPFPILSEQKKIADILATWDKCTTLLEFMIIENKKLLRSLRIKYFNTTNFNPSQMRYVPLVELVTYQGSSLSMSNLSTKPVDGKMFPVYGANDIVGYADTYQYDCNYIAILKDGSGVGRISKCVAYSSILGTQGAILSTDYEMNDYLYHFLSTIDFRHYTIGSAVPHLYFSDYKSIKVPMYQDEKRKQIVDILNLCEVEISLYSSLLNEIRNEKKFLLQQLLIGKVRVKVS